MENSHLDNVYTILMKKKSARNAGVVKMFLQGKVPCGDDFSSGLYCTVRLLTTNSFFQLSILGTPAEEGGGGKITMIDANFFYDVDVALMAHPSPVNRYVYNSLAIER